MKLKIKMKPKKTLIIKRKPAPKKPKGYARKYA